MTVQLVTNPDATKTLIDEGRLLRTLAVHGPDIDPLLMAQVAVAQIVAGLRVRVQNADALVKSMEPQGQEVRIGKIILDWPKSDAGFEPLTVLIAEGPGGTTIVDRIGEVDTDVVDGVIVERQGDARVEIEIIGVTAHTDERRGLRAALIGALTSEPSFSGGGRRVMLCSNPGIMVTLTLVSLRNIDGGDAAQENRRVVSLIVQAEAPILRVIDGNTSKPKITMNVGEVTQEGTYGA
jgi:hypothetical protein